MTLADLVPPLLTYAELRRRGLSRRQIGRALADGRLLRVRKGRYLAAPADPKAVEAARAGGRLDCLTLLRGLGVFVHAHDDLHFVVPAGSSRLCPPPAGSVRHWRRPSETARAILIEALAQACRCQSVPAAIATLDSAWHRGLIGEDDLDDVFELLPGRYRALRPLLDRRCESGPESLVRLMLRRLGCRFTPQAQIPGVGRVDFLVDGWLVIECDSREFHSDWVTQRADYTRNLAAARQGLVILRITAEDILFRPDDVLLALRGAISARGVIRRVQNSPSARVRRTGALSLAR
ncbi:MULTISPECIES: type IV toxin-antitoxin system AbiEi family antitoxin domain-containing protein [Microbacterium]|uniref:type IV toxin-antitoxin system AbiEi family antitoxin domain-containing protein n=1 Tax=Microbacterium TaxID=33882 RepID=UPI00146CE80D|nr:MULTISPECIES: type IV toxin-antitoxin system AbiEi family antitoxin domain-containing protein [Microbacterium]